MPRFIVMLGREKVDAFSLTQPRVLIGRSSKADIMLDNLMVSRRHAEIRQLGPAFMIVKLAGKNGVFVNGRWIDTLMLEDGDVIEIGKYSVRFELPADEMAKLVAEERKEAGAGFRVTTTEMMSRIDDEEAGRKRKQAQAATLDSNVDTMQLKPNELAKVREQMALVKKAHLAVLGTPPQAIDLDRERTTLGKAEDCHLTLDTGWLAPKVSAIVTRTPKGEYIVEAMGGTVKVGGERLKGSRVLSDGDMIDVEGTRVRFHTPAR